MDLKSQIATWEEWSDYQRELLRGFRRAKVHYRKIKEVKVLMSRIDWRFSRISNEEVLVRRDHKESYQENIIRWRQEAHELIEILNENFVLEILLGD